MSDSGEGKSPRSWLDTAVNVIILAGILFTGALVFNVFGTGVINTYPEDEITIAAVLPFSGQMVDWGEYTYRGIEMAKDNINAKGGINGIPINVIYYDDAGSINETLKAWDDITAKKIPVVLGSIQSDNSIAMAQLADKRDDIIVISPSSTSVELTKYKNFYRIVSSDKYQGSGIAKITSGLKNVSSVLFYYLNNSYGSGLKDSYMEEMEEISDGRINVTYISVGDNEKIIADDIRAQFAEANPDMTIMVLYADQGADILMTAKDAGYSCMWAGSDNVVNDNIINLAGNYTEGMIGFIPSVRYVDPDFAAKYKAKWGSDFIPHVLAYGYDVLMVASSAISSGGYNADGIRNVLKDLRYLGLCGPIKFDENGDVPPAYDIFIVDNGEWVVVPWKDIISSSYYDLL